MYIYMGNRESIYVCIFATEEVKRLVHRGSRQVSICATEELYVYIKMADEVYQHKHVQQKKYIGRGMGICNFGAI